MKYKIPDEKFGYVNANRACEILGVSKSWLYKATSRCCIKHYKIGSKLTFKVEDLLKFVEDNCIDVLR